MSLIVITQDTQVVAPAVATPMNRTSFLGLISIEPNVIKVLAAVEVFTSKNALILAMLPLDTNESYLKEKPDAAVIVPNLFKCTFNGIKINKCLYNLSYRKEK